MTIEDLVKEGKIRHFQATEAEIKRSLEIAHRDLAQAQKLFQEKSLDWCFVVAYNAVLQTSRAYMFSQGYRPREKDGHKAVGIISEKGACFFR
ncbi:MAG: HEPN domain-containing protein [bacterium]